MNFSHLFQPVPLRDWVLVAIMLVGIGILIGISELMRRYLNWPQEFSRKSVHILVGLLTCLSPMFLQTSLPLILIAAMFALINLIAAKKGMLKGMHGKRESYGTFFYPLSFLMMVLLAWPDYKIIIIASMITLAFADAAAAIVGESITHPREYVLITDRKSWQGSLTMFSVSAGGIFLLLYFHPGSFASTAIDPLHAGWYALVIAIIVTAAEALSLKGSDNLTVPLITGLMLYFFLTHSVSENWQLTIGMILGGMVALISYRLRFLDASGAVATFILATIIFGFGGWKWSLPILLFFVLSSFLSKMGKAIKHQHSQMYEKGSQRDYAQVLANGGIAGGLMILFMFFESSEIYLYFLASLAAATADTWATELGTLSRQQPRLITNFQPVPTGTSGGITIPGFISAFGGALIIAGCGWFFFNGDYQAIHIPLLFMIAISGLLGSVVDSYLGASVQIQFRCPVCNKVTEKTTHCNKNATTPLSGLRWITNDMVNFFNTLSAPVFLFISLIFMLN